MDRVGQDRLHVREQAATNSSSPKPNRGSPCRYGLYGPVRQGLGGEDRRTVCVAHRRYRPQPAGGRRGGPDPSGAALARAGRRREPGKGRTPWSLSAVRSAGHLPAPCGAADRRRPCLSLLVFGRAVGPVTGRTAGQQDRQRRVRSPLPGHDPGTAGQATGVQSDSGGADADPRRCGTVLPGPDPWRGTGSASGRSGHLEGRRVSHLSSGGGGGRSPDGYHHRGAGRGMDQLDTQTPAVVQMAGLARAGIRAHAVVAQSRQVEDLQTQEPGCPAAMVPRAGLSARGVAQFPTIAGLSSGRWRSGDVLLCGIRGGFRLVEGFHRGADLRWQEAGLVEWGLYPVAVRR